MSKSFNIVLDTSFVTRSKVSKSRSVLVFLYMSEKYLSSFRVKHMAERQGIGNLSVPNNPRVTNNITKRNEQQYLLLLSMTYPFKFSHTKKLHVGLQSIKEES